MMQILQAKTAINANSMYVNLLDTKAGNYMNLLGWKPLIVLTSQQTKKSKIFIPTTFDATHGDRYVEMSFLTWFTSESLTGGLIILGTDEYPYGLYDLTIYANTSSTNLDPTTLSLIYSGLANVYAPDSDQPVFYNEYTANDTDNDVVYITNPTG